MLLSELLLGGSLFSGSSFCSSGLLSGNYDSGIELSLGSGLLSGSILFGFCRASGLIISYGLFPRSLSSCCFFSHMGFNLKGRGIICCSLVRAENVVARQKSGRTRNC